MDSHRVANGHPHEYLDEEPVSRAAISRLRVLLHLVYLSRIQSRVHWSLVSRLPDTTPISAWSQVLVWPASQAPILQVWLAVGGRVACPGDDHNVRPAVHLMLDIFCRSVLRDAHGRKNSVSESSQCPREQSSPDRKIPQLAAVNRSSDVASRS